MYNASVFNFYIFLIYFIATQAFVIMKIYSPGKPEQDLESTAEQIRIMVMVYVHNVHSHT